MSPIPAVAERIRRLRKEAKLTQAALGAELGVSRSHLAKIESGGDLPGRELLVALTTYFDVSLDWLTEGRGDPRPARALNEREALLLRAFRQLPEEEAELHLRLMMQRSRQEDA